MDDNQKLRRILVVDGSRVVRATLCKHLKGSFEIREEGDGESAWQTLMLDSSLAAVITGLHTPRLDAHDLLARLKGSSMRRLREIPFALITSETDNKVERDFDRSLGVDGFINKSMEKDEVVDYLNNMLDSAVFTQSVILPEAPKEEPPPPPVEHAAPLFRVPVLLDRVQFQQTVSALAMPTDRNAKVCALVFRIDKRKQLIASFGEEIIDMVDARIASLVVAKVGASDSVGRYRGDQLGIISMGVDLEQGVRFARRVCKSVAAGQITVRGKKITLTASVGVASNSDDTVADGNALLALAEKRLNQALVCGGNTVASMCKPGCPLHDKKLNTTRLIEALGMHEGEEHLANHLGSLGLEILPLLQVMNQQLGLGLPLADIEKQLHQRAETEDQQP